MAALRAHGHDVIWMLEAAPGTPDSDVLAIAQGESRVVVTFDKDFGELAFRRGAAAESGVVLFRISTGSPEAVARIAVAVFQNRDDWSGTFAVVEDGRIRIRSVKKTQGQGPE